MGRVCVDSFDVSRNASPGEDKGSAFHHNTQWRRSSVPTSYLIENGYDSNNHGSFHTSGKRRSVTRSSISSIYGSTPRPSFSSYPFSRTDSFSSAATSSYSNVFEDEKQTLSVGHGNILEQDDDEEEEEEEEGEEEEEEEGDEDEEDEDDGDEEEEDDGEGIRWSGANEASYIPSQLGEGDDDDDDEEEDDDVAGGDVDDDDNDDEQSFGNTPFSMVSAGVHRSSSMRSHERPIIYRCKSCYCDICISSLIISKDFWGNKGEAYFVKNVLNVREDAKEVMKHMRTGQYGVKAIYCVQCDTVIGWKYITSIEPVEKYKVGKYVIEKNLLKTYKVPGGVS